MYSADRNTRPRLIASLIRVSAPPREIWSPRTPGLLDCRRRARAREIGIRLALEARRDGIMGLVLGQALRLAVVGAGLGILVSFGATRGIEAYLWGVSRTDVVTLVVIAVGVAGHRWLLRWRRG